MVALSMRDATWTRIWPPALVISWPPLMPMSFRSRKVVGDASVGAPTALMVPQVLIMEPLAKSERKRPSRVRSAPGSAVRVPELTESAEIWPMLRRPPVALIARHC